MALDKLLLSVRGFEVHYPGSPIGPLDLSIARAAVTYLPGPNGCGKSTLLRWIAGQCHGSGRIDGPDARIAFLPQYPSQILTPWLSLEEHISAFARPPGEHHRRELLEWLHGLSWPEEKALSSTTPAMLSFGLRQTFALAFVLSTPGTNLFLLDEPFSALDVARRRLALECMKKHARERDLAFVVTSHADLGETDVIVLDAFQNVASSSSLKMGVQCAG